MSGADDQTGDVTRPWAFARRDVLPLMIRSAFPDPDLVVAYAGDTDPAFSTMMPPSAELVALPAGEAYIAAMTAQLRDRAARQILLIAPTPDLPRGGPKSGLHSDGKGLTDRSLRAALDLPHTHRVGVVYREAHINSPGRSAVLENTWKGWRPAWLITMPPTPPLLSPGCDTRARPALVVFERATDGPAALRCVRVGEPVPPVDVVESSMRHLARTGGGSNELGFVLRLGLPEGMVLNAVELDPRTNQERAALSQFGAAERLGDLVEALPSLSQARSDSATSDGDQVLVLRGRAIRPDGTVDLSQCDSSTVSSSATRLRAGDLVLRRLAAAADGRLLVASIPAHAGHLVAGPHVIALRAKGGTATPHLRVLKEFLPTELAFRQLSAAGHQLHINRSTLLDLIVPAPDDILVALLSELDDAVEQLSAWSREADLLRRSALGEERPAEARRRLLAEGRRLNQRVRAARQVDDLSHRVRTQYPYPLASLWRILEASPASIEGVHASLHFVESLAALLGSTAAAVAAAEGEPLNSYLELTRTVQVRGGASFSQWTVMLAEVAARKEVRPESFLGGLKDSWNDDTASAFARMAAVRNDFGHLRLTTPSDLRSIAETASQDAAWIAARFGCLTEFTYRLIVSARWDSLAEVTHFGARDLAGDQAVLPIVEKTTDAQGIESGSLYLVDHPGDHRLLRPFVSAHECGECRQWATFVLDGWDRRTRTPILKTLECGHTKRDADVGKAFQRLQMFVPTTEVDASIAD